MMNKGNSVPLWPLLFLAVCLTTPALAGPYSFRNNNTIVGSPTTLHPPSPVPEHYTSTITDSARFETPLTTPPAIKSTESTPFSTPSFSPSPNSTGHVFPGIQGVHYGPKIPPGAYVDHDLPSVDSNYRRRSHVVSDHADSFIDISDYDFTINNDSFYINHSEKAHSPTDPPGLEHTDFISGWRSVKGVPLRNARRLEAYPIASVVVGPVLGYKMDWSLIWEQEKQHNDTYTSFPDHESESPERTDEVLSFAWERIADKELKLEQQQNTLENQQADLVAKNQQLEQQQIALEEQYADLAAMNQQLETQLKDAGYTFLEAQELKRIQLEATRRARKWYLDQMWTVSMRRHLTDTTNPSSTAINVYQPPLYRPYPQQGACPAPPISPFHEWFYSLVTYGLEVLRWAWEYTAKTLNSVDWQYLGRCFEQKVWTRIVCFWQDVAQSMMSSDWLLDIQSDLVEKLANVPGAVSLLRSCLLTLALCSFFALFLLPRKNEILSSSSATLLDLPGHLPYPDDREEDQECNRSRSIHRRHRSASHEKQCRTQRTPFRERSLRKRGRYGLGSRSLAPLGRVTLSDPPATPTFLKPATRTSSICSTPKQALDQPAELASPSNRSVRSQSPCRSLSHTEDSDISVQEIAAPSPPASIQYAFDSEPQTPAVVDLDDRLDASLKPQTQLEVSTSLASIPSSTWVDIVADHGITATPPHQSVDSTATIDEEDVLPLEGNASVEPPASIAVSPVDGGSVLHTSSDDDIEIPVLHESTTSDAAFHTTSTPAKVEVQTEDDEELPLPVLQTPESPIQVVIEGVVIVPATLSMAVDGLVKDNDDEPARLLQVPTSPGQTAMEEGEITAPLPQAPAAPVQIALEKKDEPAPLLQESEAPVQIALEKEEMPERLLQLPVSPVLAALEQEEEQLAPLPQAPASLPQMSEQREDEEVVPLLQAPAAPVQIALEKKDEPAPLLQESEAPVQIALEKEEVPERLLQLPVSPVLAALEQEEEQLAPLPQASALLVQMSEQRENEPVPLLQAPEASNQTAMEVDAEPAPLMLAQAFSVHTAMDEDEQPASLLQAPASPVHTAMEEDGEPVPIMQAPASSVHTAMEEDEQPELVMQASEALVQSAMEEDEQPVPLSQAPALSVHDAMEEDEEPVALLQAAEPPVQTAMDEDEEPVLVIQASASCDALMDEHEEPAPLMQAPVASVCAAMEEDEEPVSAVQALESAVHIAMEEDKAPVSVIQALEASVQTAMVEDEQAAPLLQALEPSVQGAVGKDEEENPMEWLENNVKRPNEIDVTQEKERVQAEMSDVQVNTEDLDMETKDIEAEMENATLDLMIAYVNKVRAAVPTLEETWPTSELQLPNNFEPTAQTSITDNMAVAQIPTPFSPQGSTSPAQSCSTVLFESTAQTPISDNLPVPQMLAPFISQASTFPSQSPMAVRMRPIMQDPTSGTYTQQYRAIAPPKAKWKPCKPAPRLVAPASVVRPPHATVVPVSNSQASTSSVQSTSAVLGLLATQPTRAAEGGGTNSRIVRAAPAKWRSSEPPHPVVASAPAIDPSLEAIAPPSNEVPITTSILDSYPTIAEADPLKNGIAVESSADATARMYANLESPIAPGDLALPVPFPFEPPAAPVRAIKSIPKRAARSGASRVDTEVVSPAPPPVVPDLKDLGPVYGSSQEAKDCLDRMLAYHPPPRMVNPFFWNPTTLRVEVRPDSYDYGNTENQVPEQSNLNEFVVHNSKKVKTKHDAPSESPPSEQEYDPSEDAEGEPYPDYRETSEYDDEGAYTWQDYCPNF